MRYTSDGKLRLTVKSSGAPLAEVLLDSDDWIGFEINGRQFLALDCFYLDDRHGQLEEGEVPRLVVGETLNDAEGTWVKLDSWTVDELTAPGRWP